MLLSTKQVLERVLFPSYFASGTFEGETHEKKKHVKNRGKGALGYYEHCNKLKGQKKRETDEL